MSKPLDFLHNALKKPIILKLRGRREVRGILQSYDQHLNLHLEDTEIIYYPPPKEDGEEQEPVTEVVGSIVLRGDNVILISPP